MNSKTNAVTPNQRNSNLELFRIISMLLIVAHHYVVNSGLLGADYIFSAPTSGRSMFLLLLGAWGKTGINCFVFITGYFMCKSNITARKFFKLLFEIMFYKIIIYLIFLLSGYTSFSLSGLVKAVLPFTSLAQNFTGCFLVFFLLIPFINILLKNLNERQHLYCALFLVFVYVILGTIFRSDVQFNYVTWFVVLYLVASYIRLYPKKIFDNTFFWGIMLLLSILFSVISVIGLNYIASRYNVLSAYFFLTDSNKVLAFTNGFTGFMFFKNLTIKNSRFINTVAASAFGVFLIHSNSAAMRSWLWGDVLKVLDMYHSKYLILHAVLSVLGIYVVCTVIDYLRILCIEKPCLKLWDKYSDKLSAKFSAIEKVILRALKIETER